MWREVAPIQVHSQILFDESYIYTFVLNITSYLALYPPSTRLFYLVISSYYKSPPIFNFHKKAMRLESLYEALSAAYAVCYVAI